MSLKANIRTYLKKTFEFRSLQNELETFLSEIRETLAK